LLAVIREREVVFQSSLVCGLTIEVVLDSIAKPPHPIPLPLGERGRVRGTPKRRMER